MNTNDQKRQEIWTAFDELIKETLDFQSSYYITPSDFDEWDIDNIMEKLQDAIMENYDIIYYSRAMEYLSDNDSSLTRGLCIASEYGYEIDKLNSEILASLVHREDMESDLRHIKNDIQELLDQRALTINDWQNENT